MAKYLYFQPVIYMPYKVCLRKADSVVLEKMWIENGQEIDLSTHIPKPRHEPNANFIRIDFPTPLYMDVDPLNGVDEAITFVMKYSINLAEGRSTKVVHRQHIVVRHKGLPRSPSINHFSTRFAAPAVFGLEGKKYITGWLDRGECKVIQFGVEDESASTWLIETIEMLFPNSAQLHQTIH